PARRDERPGTAPPARPAQAPQPALPAGARRGGGAERPRQQLRAGLPDADGGAGRAGRDEGAGSDRETLRIGQPPGRPRRQAGGGVKGGVHYGETDEIGHKAAVDRVSVNDLHATILALLGLDHTKLTYKYNGRNFRLTDVAGVVVNKIIA